MTVTVRTAHDHGAEDRALDVGAEAVVFLGAGRPLERIRVPTVLLRPGEALIAVEVTTFCARDRSILAGVAGVRCPVVLGHEQVGRVVAIAELRPPRDIDRRRLAVGDRVVWGAGVAGRRYGHERVARGWELSGGCATHVHLLARTPVARIGEDAPGIEVAAASCGAVTAEQLRAAVARVAPGPAVPLFSLMEMERAFAAVAAGARVGVRPQGVVGGFETRASGALLNPR